MTAEAFPGRTFAVDPLSMDQRIEWITQEVERRLEEPLDIARLASAVNLSPSRFSHLFRSEMGMSPMRFVRDRRMERARLLLEQTFLSVKEVMTLVGCSDPSHFTRDFRRYHGLPPRAWRAADRNSTGQPAGELPTDSGSGQENQD